MIRYNWFKKIKCDICDNIPVKFFSCCKSNAHRHQVVENKSPARLLVLFHKRGAAALVSGHHRPLQGKKQKKNKCRLFSGQFFLKLWHEQNNSLQELKISNVVIVSVFHQHYYQKKKQASYHPLPQTHQEEKKQASISS